MGYLRLARCFVSPNPVDKQKRVTTIHELGAITKYHNTYTEWKIQIRNLKLKSPLEEDCVVLFANGGYSLIKANHLFKLAIDKGLSQQKSKILIDVNSITGTIPFMDRFRFSEYLANYKIAHALGKINRIAVVGQEPIVHKERFGETVAVNRGINVRVFTDKDQASIWLYQ